MSGAILEESADSAVSQEWGMGNGIDLENFCVLSLPWGMLITINFVSLLKLTVKKCISFIRYSY